MLDNGSEVALGMIGVGLGESVDDAVGEGLGNGLIDGVETLVQINFFPDFTHASESFPTLVVMPAFVQTPPTFNVCAALDIEVGTNIVKNKNSDNTNAFCRFISLVIHWFG